MKYKVLVISALGMLIFGGCSKSVKVPTVEVAETPCVIEKIEAPKWVCSPSKEGFYTAIGYAKSSGLGFGFTSNTALHDGEEKLSTKISKDVKSKLKSFMVETKLGARETRESISTEVSNQVSDLNIKALNKEAVWQSPADNMYLMVSLSKEKINESAIRQIEGLIESDRELSMEFNDNNGIDNLEKEFN